MSPLQHLHHPLKLIIGQKNYSSWSMRAWLLLKFLEVPFEETTVQLYRTDSRAKVQRFGGETGLVPVLVDRGFAIWDTLAIFEHLYETHPAVWPADPLERARARSFSGEVHSAFTALRASMPVNTRARGRQVLRSVEVAADIERVSQIWRGRNGTSPWLFGSFSGADIMFAPIATRFRTYGVELGGSAGSYMARLLEHPLVDEWSSLGEQEMDTIDALEVGGAPMQNRE